MEKAKEWFEYQTERLESIGLGDFANFLSKQKEFVLEKTQTLKWDDEGTIPFFAVIPHQCLKEIAWARINGQVMESIRQLGHIICRKNDLRGCGEINLLDQEVAEEIPSAEFNIDDPYWIFDIQTGTQNVGVPQDKVVLSLREEKRRLLTLSEAAFLTFFTAATPFEGAHGVEVPFDLGTGAMMSKWIGVKPIQQGVETYGDIQPSARLGIFRSGRLYPRLVNYFSNEGGQNKGTPSCIV